MHKSLAWLSENVASARAINATNVGRHFVAGTAFEGQESHSLAITRWRQKAAVCLTDDRLPRINSPGHSVIFPRELTAEIAFRPSPPCSPPLSTALLSYPFRPRFINQHALPEERNQNSRKWIIIAGGWKILFRLNYRWRATLTVNRITMYGAN